MKESKPIRIKITSKTCESNILYLVIRNRRLTVFNRGYKKIHIEQLAANATELVFKLEDATTAEEAVKALASELKGKEFKIL